MPAYLRDITPPPCGERCGRRASVELVNHVNAPIGRYCRRCGTRLRNRYNARLEAECAKKGGQHGEG